MKEVVFNEGLEKIGRAAFMGCSSLQSCLLLECIILPSSVVEIEDNVFSDCIKLKRVVLNKGLQKIGDESFRGCSTLQSIKLPSTVVEIGSYAFSGCINLNQVVLNNAIQKIGFMVFEFCPTVIQFDYTGKDNVVPRDVTNVRLHQSVKLVFKSRTASKDAYSCNPCNIRFRRLHFPFAECSCQSSS